MKVKAANPSAEVGGPFLSLEHVIQDDLGQAIAICTLVTTRWGYLGTSPLMTRTINVLITELCFWKSGVSKIAKRNKDKPEMLRKDKSHNKGLSGKLSAFLI